MATRFLRLDVSPAARDFLPVAAEPGLLLLDKSNANYRVLRKWLGRYVAEPQWSGDTVDFYVCDDQQDRPNDVRCEPTTAGDLQQNSGLNQEFKELTSRLEHIQPAPREAGLYEAVVRHFRRVTAESGLAQVECHFFKYREGGTWRLVWGWGYERRNLAPATATICTNPRCSLLFVRYSDGGRDCPGCERQPEVVATTRRGHKLWVAAALLAVAVIAGIVGYEFREYRRGTGDSLPSGSLRAVPDAWTTRVGGQQQFSVVRTDAEGKPEDVTLRAVVVAEDPRMVRVDGTSATGYARRRGETVLHFYCGGEVAHATVQIQPAKNPVRLVMEPGEKTLGIGTTALMRAFGEYEDGLKVELTEAAQWTSAPEGTVYCLGGRLEGMNAGEATVAAQFRATEADPLLSVETHVKVVDERYRSLELAVRPSLLSEGKAAQLEATVTSESGQSRSVVGSSQLKWEVEPADLAAVEKDYLRALRVGRGTLKAAFRDLTAKAEVQGMSESSDATFIPHPKELRLAIGETAEIQVVASGPDPIRLVSSVPQIVEVLSSCRVVARSAGKAEVTVSQEAREAKILVEVTAEEIKGIRFIPARVSVPVDGLVALRLVGSGEKDREIDLAPDRVAWEQIPTATVAELDMKGLQVRGRAATGGNPQALVARWGDLRATALVDVLAPPLQIELTPADPVRLPVGRAAKLGVWAKYGDGRRIELPSQRIQWKVEPSGVDGLELDISSGQVRATKPGLGPVFIRAFCQGSQSNPVELRTVDAPFAMRIDSDRSVLAVDDEGRFRATVPGEDSLNLVIDGVAFESSDPKTLAIERLTGVYRAIQPGKVTVKASHPKVNPAAQADVEILARDQLKLVFRPAKVQLPVGGRQPLNLFAVAAGREDKLSLAGDTAGLSLAIGRPEAIQWKPPLVIGAVPAAPFEVVASYRGVTARAEVEVIDSEKGTPPQIRAVPSRVTLAKGQIFSPTVEQRVAGGDQWVEVDPLSVQWKVPEGLRWTPAAGNLRPQCAPVESAQGRMELPAEYRGAKAVVVVEITDKGPSSGPMVVVREPDGEGLAVGSTQRYAILVQNGDRQEPAAGVRWLPEFENDYVSWKPPVLTAKRAGHEQRLGAAVGDQRVWWTTRTVAEPPPPDDPSPPQDRPRAVRLVTDQKQPIVLPVRSQFSDLRVVADFPDRASVDVTLQATLSVDAADPSQPSLSCGEGRLTAEQPGKATVRAEFNGVRSTEGLSFEVLPQSEVQTLKIEPANFVLKPDETTRLKVLGFSGSGEQQRLMGDITARPDLEWKSDQPDVVLAEGPILTARGPGKARVSVRAGNTEAVTEITVTAAASELVVRPRVLRLKEGQTKWIGKDVTVARNGVVLDELDVVSSSPSNVLYNPRNRSVQGVAAGSAELAITAGSQGLKLPVVVTRSTAPREKGRIVIEPAVGTLAVGESSGVRVILVDENGDRLDCTDLAAVQSSDPRVLGVVGSRLTGIAAGKSVVAATLPRVAQPGRATFSVKEEQFRELRVTPPGLRIALGEERTVRIFGIGSAGRCELSDHPDLKITTGGERPDAVEWRGTGRLRGVAPGQANLQVAWRGLVAKPVPVQVHGDPVSMLRISPNDATVEVGKEARFLVFARSGDRERALSAEDGVELDIADTSVARSRPQLTVVGSAPGTTAVAASLGGQRAVANLTVVGTYPPPRRGWIGLRFVPDVLSMQLGVPAAPVRLVKYSGGDQQEDVIPSAKVTVADPQVADVRWTAAGPLFLAKKVGETQATATHGNLTTLEPLSIRVVPSSPETAPEPKVRFEVHPDPLRLRAGQSGGFQRAQLIPGNGGPPVDVDYRVESRTPQIAGVEGQKRIRGIASGLAQVRIWPAGVGDKYEGVSTDVAVQVEGISSEIKAARQLTLTGPSRTTVGAEVKYRAELGTDANATDVTEDGTVLVLDRDQMAQAEVGSGCTLLGKRPGTINVRARYKDQISNVIPVQIDRVAETFARLELEIDRQSLCIGETRPYRIWGYPADGGPRQDLTSQVGGTPGRPEKAAPQVLLKVIEPASSDAPIVVHEHPAIVAKAVGRFQTVATCGPNLRSEVVDLAILGDAPPASGLVAVPPTVTIRVGERTPVIRVMVQQGPSQGGRYVGAQLASLDEKIVAAAPHEVGKFVGLAPGKTQLRATWGKMEAFVGVTVEGDPFQKVAIREVPEWKPGNRFAVILDVDPSVPGDAGLEYRVVTPGNPATGPWKPTTAVGAMAKCQLTGPDLRVGPPDTDYHLVLEARNREQQIIARYPLTFKLLITPTIRQQTEAKKTD